MLPAVRRRALSLLGAALLAGCAPSPGPEDVRTLHCEGVTDARAAALCVRMERELEFERGGHALLFGFPAWRCTERTFERLMCVEPRVDLATVKAARDGLEESDFSSCLANLQFALENAARPKHARKPPFDVECE